MYDELSCHDDIHADRFLFPKVVTYTNIRSGGNPSLVYPVARFITEIAYVISSLIIHLVRLNINVAKAGLMW